MTATCWRTAQQGRPRAGCSPTRCRTCSMYQAQYHPDADEFTAEQELAILLKTVRQTCGSTGNSATSKSLQMQVSGVLSTIRQ